MYKFTARLALSQKKTSEATAALLYVYFLQHVKISSCSTVGYE